MTETRSNLTFPNLISADVSAMGQKHLESLATVQKGFLDALGKANRIWVNCLNEEATLTSDFTKKVSTATSIPEAAAAYQDWASRQIELLSRHAQKVLEETQSFTKACTQLMGDGRGAASL